MRMIGQLPAGADARRFVDYLLTRHIAAHAEEGQSGDWQIWVEHDDHLDAGLAELRQFQANPADARFDSAANAASIRKQEAKAAEKTTSELPGRANHDVRTAQPGRAGDVCDRRIVGRGVCFRAFRGRENAAPVALSLLCRPANAHAETLSTAG